MTSLMRSIAQPGRAPSSGGGGRRFESSYSDQASLQFMLAPDPSAAFSAIRLPVPASSLHKKHCSAFLLRKKPYYLSINSTFPGRHLFQCATCSTPTGFVDENPASASKYQVTGWPTFLFFKKGEKQMEIVGGKLAEATLYDWVKLMAPKERNEDS